MNGAYPPVVCLTGDLGSGKTTFVQGFAAAAGVASRMISPTFIIVRRYPLKDDWDTLYHIDLYRIERSEDMAGIGLAEMLDEYRSIVLIEWSERLGEALPARRVDVHCEALQEGAHRIQMEVVNG